MRRKTRTKALSWLLSLAMILSFVSGLNITAYATEASTAYVNAAGEAQTPVNATVLENSSGDTPISWNASWYVIPAGGVTIANRITVNGEVSLILTDGATLNAAGGIEVESGSLTIYGQSEGTGALNANIGENGMPDAPINGRQGSITINGGKVSATSTMATGINAEQSLTINGGEVTATGYQGIGGSSDTIITINGGNVQAIGTSGNGISVGSGLTINGGDVTATGSDGISSFNGAVTINDGTVHASGTNMTGISASGGLIINGGEVTAESTSEWGGCAISASETFTINPDYAVTAGSDKDSASEVGDYAEGYNYQYYKWANIKMAAPKTPVSYMDWDATNKQLVEKKGADARSYYTIVKSNSDEFSEVKWSNGWFVVNSEVEIAGSITFKGDVKLILCDGAKLTAKGGIRAEYSFDENYSLTIYGQKEGTGELIVSSGNMPDAAIRGDNSSITINGGKVSATSDQSCGIYADNDVTINGGEVTAESTSAWGAEGIESFKGNIVVNGGTVKAKGSKAFYTNEQDRGVTINGGSIEATGVIYVNGDNGNVTISGGNVTVTSDETAIFARGDINVSSGTVTATGGTDCGIFSYGDVTVSGGGLTTSGHIAIQANKDNGGVTISGGTVTATGTGDDGIGISTNYNGSVTISGGAATLVGSGCAISTSSVTIGNGIAVNAGASETNNAPIDNFSESFFTEGYTYKWVQVGNFHEHSLTNYTLISGDTITATCSNTNKCPLNNNQATLTIIASTDSGGTAALTGDVNAFDVSDANITYQKKNGGSWTNITADQISNSGFYKAGITVGGKTASVTYGVNEIIKDGSFNPATANGDFTVPSIATANASVTINTEPALGYELDTLTVKKSNDSQITVTKSGNDGSFTMPEESVTVSATFKKINSSITISTLENGTVLANKTTADYGDTVTLTITPNAGYALGTITARDGKDEPVSITNGSFTMPASAVTVSATFVFIDYTVTVGTVEHGSIQASKTSAAHIGDEISLTVTPDTGYELDTLKFNDTAISADGTGAYKFTMPASNVTVTATFKKINYTVTVTTPTNGTLSADKTTAQMGDTVTLTVTPNGGYKVSNISVTGTTAVKANDTTYTFTMPASNVTASATFTLKDCDITVSDSISGGTVTVNPTTVEIGDEVTLSAIPDTGYQFVSYAVTKADGSGIAVTNNKFTMPAGIVTVSAMFVPRSVPVKLAVSGGNASCTAKLLTVDDYAVVPEDFSSKIGDKFILSVTIGENCDYVIKFGNDEAAAISSMKEFTADEYEAYAKYLKEQKLEVPSMTDLFLVTMPGMSAENLNISVAFGEVKAFTILYKPSTSAETVWCKFTDSNGKAYGSAMKHDLNMDGVNVWTLSVNSAFTPSSIAFAATIDDVANAALTNCTAQTTADSWNTISGGQYMVIGGNAKTVAAVFANEDAGTEQFEIAVCATDGNGNLTSAGTVKAPAAPTKEGFTFKGWRGFKFDDNGKASEQIYAAGASIPVRANTIISALWNPIKPIVEIEPNNGDNSYTIEARYGEPILKPEGIERIGFILENWKVGENVTESGRFFSWDSVFDFNTGITDDLELEAQWKHVHSYTCVPLDYAGFKGALNSYSKYFPYLHVNFCGCADVNLEAHTFQNGVCTGCGYTKPNATEVKLEVSYWKAGAASAWINELPRTVKRNEEVTVSAYYEIGDWQFSKWQYSTDNGQSWKDLAATTLVGFIIPCSAQVRAIYVSTITQPQIELSATKYVTEAQGYNWDSVLFQMNYKLPDGYTFVDAGVRMGDNDGISYFELKEVKHTTGEKAAMAGLSFGLNIIPFVGGGLTAFATDMTKAALSDPEYCYDKRENSVLDEMTATTLSEYMFKFKPINASEYPPVYWETKAQTKSQCGSVNTLTPLKFIQKNNGNHYIYGMAYLTYKTPDGETKTIYTEALPTTRDDIPTYTVKADPKGMTNTLPQ